MPSESEPPPPQQILKSASTVSTTGSGSSTLEPNNPNYASEKLVKLIAVGLKEASTDSPSFRASINYLDQCISDYEETLWKSVEFFKKYNNIRTALSSLSEDFKESFHSLSTRGGGVVNQDVTRPCLENTLTGIGTVFQCLTESLDFSSNTLKGLETLLTKDFEDYYAMRRNFEDTRSKYDTYLERFMAQHKAYDPHKSKEDAFQLFEIRKQYIHISLSLWILVTKLELKISNCLVEICDSLWRASPSYRNIIEFLGISKIFKNVERAKYIISAQKNSCKSLLRDLVRARVSSEEGVIELFTPSRDYNTYNPATINTNNLYLESLQRQCEKHGWVFMKSNKLNSKETVWVKRWLFVKDDLFGFLALSPNGMYVQESDKIGMLLANIRYLPEVDRKFCFEIKTYQTTLVIQVETLAELKSWLTVFRSLKLKAMETENEYASSRFEPVLEALKLTPVVEKDLELVNLPTAVNDATHDLINQALTTLNVNINLKPPLLTQYTKLSCLSHLYLSSSVVPSAVTANIWGFVNWGLYYIIDNKRMDGMDDSTLVPIQSSEISVHLKYPDYYPLELRVLDLQMRSIFEASVPNDEYALTAFKGSWAPNSQQELMCTFFLTQERFYVYTANCGLISIAPISLTSFLDAEAIEKENYDVLKLYSISGVSFKLKLYFESCFAIRDQIKYLIRNKRVTESKPLRTIINEFNKIKKVFEKAENQTESVIPLYYKKDNNNDKSIVTVASANDMESQIKLDYIDEMNLLWNKKYEMPAKALFHVLVGDQSQLLQTLLPLASLTSDTNAQQSVWRCDSKQKLIRNIWNIGSDLLSVQQEIQVMSNNKYYNIVQSTPNLRLPFDVHRKLEIRLLIFSIDSRSSKFIVYYKLKTKFSLFNFLSKIVFKQIMMFRAEELDKKLESSLGNLENEKKKISSAIKLFGPITKYDNDSLAAEEIKFKVENRKISLRTIINFIFQKVNFNLDRTTHELSKITFDCLMVLINNLKMNVTLILILMVSVFFNLLLSGKTSYSYWLERKSENYANQLVNQPTIMKRALFLKDIEQFESFDASIVSYNSSYSKCFHEFKKNSDVLNVYDNDNGRVKSKMVELGIKRNEIITELNLLNNLEKSYLSMEWKNWVLNEYKICEMVRLKHGDQFDGELKDYCQSTKMELQLMYDKLI